MAITSEQARAIGQQSAKNLTKAQAVTRARHAALVRWANEDPKANAERGQAGLRSGSHPASGYGRARGPAELVQTAAARLHRATWLPARPLCATGTSATQSPDQQQARQQLEGVTGADFDRQFCRTMVDEHHLSRQHRESPRRILCPDDVRRGRRESAASASGYRWTVGESQDRPEVGSDFGSGLDLSAGNIPEF